MTPAVPFVVGRLDHLVLRVTDLDRAVGFYGAVLGCAVARRRPEFGLVHLRAGSSLIDLVSVDGPLGRKGGPAPGDMGRNVDHLCLRIDPFDEDALLAHLAKHGVAPQGTVQQRFGADGEGPSLYFADPEGNVIELKGPPAALPVAAAEQFVARVSPRAGGPSAAGTAADAAEGRAAAAQACLQRFTRAFNAADSAAVDRELHFPHLMLAGTEWLRWEQPGGHPAGFFDALRATGWHHTRYEAITPVLITSDKVHFVVRYTRCLADDTVLSTHENLWIVVHAAGRWGISLRSY